MVRSVLERAHIGCLPRVGDGTLAYLREIHRVTNPIRANGACNMRLTLLSLLRTSRARPVGTLLR